MSNPDIPTIIYNPALHPKIHTDVHYITPSGASQSGKRIDPNDELPQTTTVGRDTGQAIQQARLAKKLKQSDLAKQLNVAPDIIRDYENGSAPRNGALLNRMGKVLGVKLTGK